MKDEKPALLSQFEYKGLWWLPDSPEKQFWGTLKYNPNEGAILELMGDFGNDIDVTLIILGTLINNKKITLYKCYEKASHGSVRNKSLQVIKISIEIAFIGIHFIEKDEIKLNNIYVHYSNLDEWIDASILNIMNYNPNEYVIKYHRNIIPIFCNNDWEISIISEPIIYITHRTSFSIKNKTYIYIESKIGRPFDDFLGLIRIFRNLMTFALIHPCYPLDIISLIENKQISTEKELKRKIEIYPGHIFYHPFYEVEFIPKFEMLFSFEDIKHNYVKVIENWINIYGKMELGLDIFFSTIYNYRMFTEHQFINLYNAFESYFRYKHRDKPNMKNEMQKIFKKYSSILSNFVINSNKFVNKLIITRQYLTHSDKTKENRSFKSEEIYPIIIRLRIIYMICLLSDVGIEIDDIGKLISRNREVRRLCGKKLIHWD